MEVNLRYVRDYFAQTKLKRVLVWILEIVLTIGLAAVLSMMFCQTVARKVPWIRLFRQEISFL